MLNARELATKRYSAKIIYLLGFFNIPNKKPVP